MRLDVYLANFWPEYSRATWQKYCLQGCVKVNGVATTAPNSLLDEDDIVTVDIPKVEDFSDHSLPVLYEDENVIVINKPIGILTHAKGAITTEFSIAEFVRPKTTFGSDGNRPGIVHRLDRDTSGVIITAKNDEAARLLGRQFSERKAKKTYLAVLEGTPTQPIAKLDLPIGRNPKAPATFRVDPKGKSAQTIYEVLSSTAKYSIVTLQPLTGRTHQLRVHMAYIGRPIVGDRIYGKPAERLYLHAHMLEITIPGSQRMTFTAPVPNEFNQKLNS